MKKSLKTAPKRSRKQETASAKPTMESPWSTRTAETAGEAKDELHNPFSDLIPEKIEPGKAPLSPVEKKPMLAAYIGPPNGPKTPVWVAPGERIVFPQLAEPKAE